MCPPGTFAPAPGLTQCVLCASIQGYSATTGAILCEACPDNTHQRVGAAGVNVTDCECVVGTFSASGNSGEACVLCPEGAVCDGGTTPPLPIAGFWRFGMGHETFFECPNADACMGVPADLAAAGGNASSHPTGCAAGYRGAMCSNWCVTQASSVSAVHSRGTASKDLGGPRIEAARSARRTRCCCSYLSRWCCSSSRCWYS
jgi:hypothetical protein